MLESMVEWMGYPMYHAIAGQSPPALSRASHATIYPYGPFQAGDGKTVMLGLQNERERKLFCERVLVQPALATDSRFDTNSKRSAARAELRAVIIEAFKQFTVAQILQRLDDAGIVNAQMNTLADVWADPQLQARERWRNVGTSAGKIAALLPPGMPDSFDARMDAVSALGEQTDAILAELGYAPEDIGRLHSAGAI
jgi:itaconate CoA-transferase